MTVLEISDNCSGLFWAISHKSETVFVSKPASFKFFTRLFNVSSESLKRFSQVQMVAIIEMKYDMTIFYTGFLAILNNFFPCLPNQQRFSETQFPDPKV